MGKYKNPASASASWAIVRKKLLANHAVPSPESTPKSADKNGAKGAADDDTSAKSTPANTPKRPGALKSQKLAAMKREADANHGMASVSLSNADIPQQAGDTYIKTEDNEGQEVQPALSTPTKKRARKAKNDDETSAKRARVARDDTTASASTIQDREEHPSSAETTSPAHDDVANGFVPSKSPSEEAQKDQDN